MKKMLLLFISSHLLLACDPAIRSARVRPDKTMNAVIDETEQQVDVFSSNDKLVELQVYGSAGAMVLGGPVLRANIVNNRDSDIRVDLKNATYNTEYSPERRNIKIVRYEGCQLLEKTTATSNACRPEDLLVPAKSSKRIEIAHAAQGEFRLPFYSDKNVKDEIVSRFKICGVLGKCETIR